MQLFVAWFFFNAHWARVTSNLSDSVAADVAVATQLFKENPTDENAQAARERVFAPTGYVFIFWLITTTVVLSLVSILFIRRQSDPIRELADAAAAFGKGQDISNFKPRGASEVRLAGQSFLKMRQRIRRHLEQRTLMLAGVSHDLRTPLTRLKLQLAMQDDTEDTRAARRDVDEMEAMLNGYLDFARGMGKEKPQRILEDSDLGGLKAVLRLPF